MLRNDNTIIDAKVQRILRFWARRLARCRGFALGEVEDLTQDLALQLLKARTTFDPHRDWHAYAAAVLRHAAANLARGRQALKRSRHHTQSLHAEHLEQDLIDVKAQREERCRDLALDVELVVGMLSKDDADLARLLMNQLISQVAVTTGMRRDRIYAQIRRLLRHFEKANLGDYLQ